MRIYKKCNQTMTDYPLLFHCKNLKKTKGGVWGMMRRIIKLMKVYTSSIIEQSEENQGWHLMNDN